MRREAVKTGAGLEEWEARAAHERDFLVHLEASGPGADMDLVCVSPCVDVDSVVGADGPGDLDVADRDFLRALDATCRQSGALARTGRALGVLADLAAGGAVAALVAAVDSLIRHNNALGRPLAVTAGVMLVAAAVLLSAARTTVLLSGYVDLRTQAMERRWIEIDD